MADQDSMSSVFPGQFYLGYEPNGINLRCNLDVVPADSELNTVPDLPQSANVSQGYGSLKNGPSAPVLEANSSAPHNLELNNAYQGNSIGAVQETDAALNINSHELGGSDVDKNAPTSDSSDSNTLVISSGIAGYVLEESEGGEGSASCVRRLSCKRRAPEHTSGQVFLGESSRSVKQAGNSQQLAITAHENAPTATRSLNIPTFMNYHPNAGQLGARIVVGSGAVGGVASSHMHQNSSAAGEADNLQRNIRQRRSASQPDSTPDNLSTWTTRNSQLQSASRPPMFHPFTHLPSPNTISTTRMVNSTPQVLQPFRRSIPNSLLTLQPFQWNGVARARTTTPSTYNNIIMNARNTFHQGHDISLRNDLRIGGSGTLLPEFQMGNLPPMPTNLRFASGRNFLGNISRNGSSSHQPSALTLFPQGNVVEQHPTTRPGFIDLDGQPQGQVCYCPYHLDASPATRESVLPASNISNTMPSPASLRPHLAMRPERRTSTSREMALRALAIVQRRNVQRRNNTSLISEVRNTLALMHSSISTLEFEDATLINRTVLLNDFDNEEPSDQHQDIYLDVDNMSYEELLALEERIGNVSTGLTEDVILENLKCWKYQLFVKLNDANTKGEVEPCCICQEEYADEDDLVKLKCEHDFHFNCIKKWLIQKNNCPICKETVVNV